MILTLVLLAASAVRIANAATALTFQPPSSGPLVQTANYTTFSNSTLHDKKVVKGKVFDRIIQVWLENTDFATAASTPIFEQLAKEGILFTEYNSVTHPSEPNYIASMGGDFFAAHDDNMYHIPPNITTVVDLLEDKGVSWAAYQENLPTDAFYGFSFSATNYIQPGAAPYPFYVRKHNPPTIFDAIANDAERIKRIRTFNDFANDVVNGTLPQWVFVTPNMVNDAHDTTIDFAAAFLQYWFVPLLKDPRVNGERTLILLTFDENENHAEQNTVWTAALGNAVPKNLRGTTDNTLYTHYSTIATVQANWGLKSLGRQDTNASIASVFDFVAKKVGHKNTPVSVNKAPQFNLSAVVAGPLNSAAFVPFAAPNVNAKGAGGDCVLLRPGLDKNLTPNKLPAPVNKTALNSTTPWQMSPESTSPQNIIPCADANCA
ncbi:phosphoesterase family-domain-containing protein [Mycena amicta]|nr:phosphoesterase family-domain-containing protein [Mycena amicta]